MGKATKKIIEYRLGRLPNDLGGLLDNADESDIKILVALLMAADESGEVPQNFSVSETLGIDEGTVNASLKFWRGAGIISAGGKSGAKKAKEKSEGQQSEQSEAPIKTAHRDGALTSEDSVSQYRTGELADAFASRKVTAEFVDEAQRIFGKTFSTYETNIVVGIVDRLSLAEESVLAVLAYVKSIGKPTLRYAEKVAISLYDEGYTSTEEIVERIAELELMRTESEKIKKLFGMGTRTLSKTEKSIFEKWVCKFGYDIEIIRLAYDITVDSIQKPVPKYADSILEKWHKEGLKTAEEIKKYTESQRKTGDGRTEGGAKSYDGEDFFKAAIERAFSDLK